MPYELAVLRFARTVKHYNLEGAELIKYAKRQVKALACGNYCYKKFLERVKGELELRDLYGWD